MSSHLEAFNSNRSEYEAWHGSDGIQMPNVAGAGIDLVRSTSLTVALGVAAASMPAAALEAPAALPVDFTEMPYTEVATTEAQDAAIMATVTVEPGDSPASIVEQLFPDATELQRYNAALAITQYNGVQVVDNPDGSKLALVQPGDVLVIPRNLSPQPDFSYTVKDGDTLARIVYDRLAEVGSTEDPYHALEIVAGHNGVTLTEKGGVPYVLIHPGQKIDLSAITPAGLAVSVPAQQAETIAPEIPVAPPIAETAPAVGPPIFVAPTTPEAALTSTPAPAPETPAPIPAEVVPAPPIPVPETAPAPTKPDITEVPIVEPSNLGPANSEGYYLMPTNDKVYGWASENYPLAGLLGAQKESRCASRETIVATYSAMEALHRAYPDIRWVLGDFNQSEGHASHERGVDVDIYDEKGIGTSVHGDPDTIVNVMKAFALTGKIKLFFFSSDSINAQFNEWAEAHDIPTRAMYEDGHSAHIHARANDEFRGEDKSGTCAPDTVYDVAPALQESTPPIAEPAPAPPVVQPAAEIAPPTPESQTYEGVLSLTSNEFRQIMQNIPSYEFAAANYSSGNGNREWGPRLSIDDIAILAYHAGWRGHDLEIAISLAAYAEGGAAPFVVNPAAGDLPGYPKDTVAVGLLQMLDRPDWSEKEPIRKREPNLNPVTNMENAYKLWESQGWNAWEAYLRGTHRPHMDEAQTAADRLSANLVANGLA